METKKPSFHFYCRNKINLFLLIYTFFCACFYDPIVTVDDTPRSPIFKEVVSPIVGAAFLNSRYKQIEPHTNLKNKKVTFEYNNFKLFELASSQVSFISTSLFKHFDFSRNSIHIRAPSIFFI